MLYFLFVILKLCELMKLTAQWHVKVKLSNAKKNLHNFNEKFFFFFWWKALLFCFETAKFGHLKALFCHRKCKILCWNVIFCHVKGIILFWNLMSTKIKKQKQKNHLHNDLTSNLEVILSPKKKFSSISTRIQIHEHEKSFSNIKTKN